MAVEGREQRIDCHGAWIIPAGARHEYWAAGREPAAGARSAVFVVAVPERFFERARAIGIDPQVTRLVQGVAMGVKAHDTALPNRFAWQAATHLCGALISDARLDEARGLDFARIDRWLRAQLSEPLRVADLAAHCGFGMRRFHQLFNEAFGETPHRYLNRLRLDAALTLFAIRARRSRISRSRSVSPTRARSPMRSRNAWAWRPGSGAAGGTERHPPRFPPGSSLRVQPALEIGLDVLHILQPERKPHHPLPNPRRYARSRSAGRATWSPDA